MSWNPARARRQAVARLNDGFRRGQLTADELAARLDAVYRALSAAELETVTSDLTDLSTPVPRRASTRDVLLVGLAGLFIVALLAAGALKLSRHAGRLAVLTTSTTTGPHTASAPVPRGPGPLCTDQSYMARFSPVTSNYPDDGRKELVSPSSYPWDDTLRPWVPGGMAYLPAAPTPSYLQDLDTVRALTNAAFVLHMAWYANQYRFDNVTLACLAVYDPTFGWRDERAASTSSTWISTAFGGNYSVVAARSPTGTCWYLLNILQPDPPQGSNSSLTPQDERLFPELGGPFGQGGGEFSATGTARSCSAAQAFRGLAWLPDEPLPPQLNQLPGSQPAYHEAAPY
jgi:hypothetical protein